MAKITFVLGGARSGKSAFAEGLAKKYKEVSYIATAEANDDEMRERIQSHRVRRPLSWKTFESPLSRGHRCLGLQRQGRAYLDRLHYPLYYQYAFTW